MFPNNMINHPEYLTIHFKTTVLIELISLMTLSNQYILKNNLCFNSNKIIN